MSFRTVRTTPLRIMDDAHTGDHYLTPAERAYLEVIAYLEARREPVLSVSIARWLKVRPPTVTHMLQRLEQKGLIRRDGGHSIALTSEGAAIAERIIRRHRLLECFLHCSHDPPKNRATGVGKSAMTRDGRRAWPRNTPCER